MSEFMLIDLWSQRHAVEHHVLDWSVEEVLRWIGYYGSIDVSDDHLFYFFRSFVGLYCPFYFDDHLNLTVHGFGHKFSLDDPRYL
ncbi:MAG: hypothetical protein ABI947_02895 [Chloroflexota bacterium]